MLKKKLASVMLVLAMVLGMSGTAWAAEEEKQESGPEEAVYYICYDENGNMIGYNMPFSLESPQAEDHTYLKTTLLQDGHISEECLGYHPNTSIWRKVSSYGFSSTDTVAMSIGVSFQGNTVSGTIGISKTTSSGFSYTISVDQSRYSKLEVYCSYDYSIYRGDICDEFTNEVISSFTYVVTNKTAERFEPVYTNHP